MKQVVDTGLPALAAPLEWATLAGGVLYTALIPVRADGSIETGDVRTQVELTLENLRTVLAAAGGTFADVTQVLVYLTDLAHAAVLNEVWPRYFQPPYPNRATVVVSALLVPGLAVEIVAHAHVGRR